MTTEITYCCTGKGSVRDGVAIALALLLILAGRRRSHPQWAGRVIIPPTGVLQRRALVKAAAPAMPTESASGERAERDSSAQLTIARHPIPERARNMEVPARALRNKLQLGKVASGQECPPPAAGGTLDHDPIRLNRDHGLAFCLSMIFSENRFPLFGIML
jgi:hypothetical protein